MKKALSLILILILMLLLFTGCDDVEPEKVDKPNQTPAETQQNRDENPAPKTEEPKTEIFKIGDSVKADNLIFTVNSVRTDEGGDFIKPDEGNIYYIIDVTVENTGDESEIVSSMIMFRLSDSEGYNYSITFGPETKGQLDGEVSPGRKIRGELVFEIPEDSTGLELEIDPTLGTGQIIVQLDR